MPLSHWLNAMKPRSGQMSDPNIKTLLKRSGMDISREQWMKEFKEKPNESENQTNHRPAIQANNLFQMFSSIPRRNMVRETGQGDCNSYAKGQAELFAVFGRTFSCLGGQMICPTCGGSHETTACPNQQIHFNQPKTPHCCPNCGGHKTVSKPPWIAGDKNEWPSSGTKTYPCPTCNETGIIWEES